MTTTDLITRWETLREAYAQAGAWVEGTRIIDAFLADIDAVSGQTAGTLLTLREAAALSGYSVEHLGRLIRQGALPNAGKHHAPRIRLADLPQRPGHFARSAKGSYDVVTDARSLGVRR
jgi:hypothetical protein